MREPSSIPEPGLPFFKYGMLCHQWTFYADEEQRKADAKCCDNEDVVYGVITLTGIVPCRQPR